MAFLEINPTKLALLLEHGTHEGELRKFFSESKNLLVMKGARVQNLPYGRRERIRAICEKLPQRTDDVLRAWFQKNVSVSDPMPLEDVLMYFDAVFNDREPLPESEAKTICRSGLSYLFSENPESGLLTFLRQPLAPTRAENGSTFSESDEHASVSIQDSPPPETRGQPVATMPQNYQLAELLASVISGDEDAIDNSLEPFSQQIRGLVEALLRLRAGDKNAAREQLSLLPDGPEAELVRSALERASHLQITSASPVGIRTLIPQAFDEDGEVNFDRYEIVGFYATETNTGVVFVEPMLLIVNNQLRHLTKEDCRQLFPDSGSVMTHKSLRRPFRRGDLVRWSVSEREGAEGRTRFHMDAELEPPILVVPIPVPSSDPDEVRNRIKSYANDSAARRPTGQQAIFLLSDNVVVASPKGSDYARDDAFDHPWQVWSSLDTWLIEGRQYCLDVSTSTASTLDLSPLDTAFRRLLKNLEFEQKSTLSKAQKREIAGLVKSQSGGEIAHRARRIAASIDQISMNSDDLDKVLNLLGSHSEVSRRVEELIAKEFEARRVEKSGLQTELSELRRKKRELEKEGREIELRNRHREESAATAVRDAFSHALRQGAATLANAEIFRLLSNGSGNPPQSEPVFDGQPHDGYQRGAISPTDVKARLSAMGINGRQASILSALSELAESSGIALVLKGTLGRQCAQVLARQGRDSVAIVDIPIGLTTGDVLKRPLANLAEVQAIAVLNANLSPFESYGGSLLDLLTEQALGEQSAPKPIFLSCLSGDLSLPLSSELIRVSLVVDLDSDWDQGEQLLDEIDVEAILLLPALRKRVIEAVSKVDETLRQYVEGALVRALAHQ